MRALLLALTVVSSGCFGGPASGPGDGPSDGPGATPVTFDVPAADPARAAAWHRDFVKTFVKRDTGSPTNAQASEFLLAELAAAGWEAQMIEYAPPGLELPTGTGHGINVVVGIKRGQTEDAVVGWVNHYDTETLTIEGAYDNGSGVAAGIELVRMFADYENNKTLVAVFFDSEELGLVASNYFVQGVVLNELARWHLVVGHDMVGINWPGHSWPMYQFIGEPHVAQIMPVEERLYREVLEFPEDGVTVLDVADRNSDERRFKEAGVPVLRMAGGRQAADYPEYHRPGDTVEYILDFVGGQANWEAGLRTVLTSTAWNIVLFDHLPHPDDPAFPPAAAALLDALADAGTAAAAPAGAGGPGPTEQRCRPCAASHTTLAGEPTDGPR